MYTPKDKPKLPRKQLTPEQSTSGALRKSRCGTRARHDQTQAQAAEAKRWLDVVVLEQPSDDEEVPKSPTTILSRAE